MVSDINVPFLCEVGTLCADCNNRGLWLLQWSLPSTKPGVSPVSPAPPATQNSLSSKWRRSIIHRLTSSLSNHLCSFLWGGDFVWFTHLPPSSFLPPFLLISPLPCCSWCVCGNLEISLWKSTWGPCVNTVTSACQRSWNAGWRDANATAKSARKSPQSVCRAHCLVAPPQASPSQHPLCCFPVSSAF